MGLISDLIEKHSNEGDIVVDCFSGSGTTAVASVFLNRNFYGCEINEDFYLKSVERLNKYSDKFNFVE